MTTQPKPNLPSDWRVFDDSEQLAQTLTKQVLQQAEQAIQQRGAFHFITAGGTTPNRCYQLLSQAEADWAHWHVYMGDERVLPVDDAERNSQALRQHWLNHVAIPPQNQHLIATELGATQAAKEYAELIEGIDRFDLGLLGMGEDGHTASLFPGHEQAESVHLVYGQGGDVAPVIIETDSPKPPAQRVSLNDAAFARCDRLIKVVTGQAKAEAVATWLAGGAPLPIQRVVGKSTEVFLSRDALPAR